MKRLFVPKNGEPPIYTKVRTPVAGLRQRLRIAIRGTGFKGKFTTTHLRNIADYPCGKNDYLLVTIKGDTLPKERVDMFEDRPVQYRLYRKYDDYEY